MADGHGADGGRGLSVEALVARYGLVALALGAGFEGETATVAGGLLAHQGLWPLPAAFVAAALGSCAADQLFFAIGRRFRDHPRVRRIAERPAFAKALAAFERHPTGFVFAFRFLYGLRTISPMAIGTTRLPTARFIALNAAAALVWAAVFTGVGYVFGHGLAAALGRLRPTQGELLTAAGIAMVVAAGLALWRLSKRTQEAER